MRRTFQFVCSFTIALAGSFVVTTAYARIPMGSQITQSHHFRLPVLSVISKVANGRSIRTRTLTIYNSGLVSFSETDSVSVLLSRSVRLANLDSDLVDEIKKRGLTLSQVQFAQPQLRSQSRPVVEFFELFPSDLVVAVEKADNCSEKIWTEYNSYTAGKPTPFLVETNCLTQEPLNSAHARQAHHLKAVLMGLLKLVQFAPKR